MVIVGSILNEDALPPPISYLGTVYYLSWVKQVKPLKPCRASTCLCKFFAEQLWRKELRLIHLLKQKKCTMDHVRIFLEHFIG